MNLKEILERRNAIKADVEARSATITSEEIAKYEKELAELDAEEKTINERAALVEKVRGLQTNTQVIDSQDPKKISQEDELEQRGKAYKKLNGTEVELRVASTVANTSAKGILIPSHLDPVVGAFPWNEVSSVVDAVSVVNLPNGNEYTKAFQISTGEGDYTLEPTKTGVGPSDKDGVYTEVDTKFDKVTIKRNKITALTYESEELMDLPEANYAQLIESNISLSIKKKIAKEIVLGDGTGNHFIGIGAESTSNLNENTFSEVEKKIDENTILDTLIEYGGEEDVEGRQAFLMNKLTLKEFTRVRGTDKKPVYNITFNGNTALIDGVRVMFTKHLAPYTTAEASAVWGIYGDFSKYALLNFGGEAVATSRDFKFDQGLIAARGRVYAGGGLVGYKAFMRLKKPALV